jgi:parallel beta-helix repeat protein
VNFVLESTHDGGESKFDEVTGSPCQGRRVLRQCIAFALLIASFVGATVLGSAPAPVFAAALRIYVSPNGSDTRSGTSTATSWRTLARVQAALDADEFDVGTQIFFRRGATYRGSLVLDAQDSGAPGAPVTFSAYGTGAPPVLSAAVPVTGWKSTGLNRWSATCAQCPATPSNLTFNGKPMSLARWPNATSGDGYRYFTGAEGNNVIIDNALPAVSSTNWTGAEMVVRSIAWVLDRLPVRSYSAGRFSLAQDSSYPLEVGYGYFLQNHPAALDTQGEWIWNAASRTITMYSATSPATTVVEVSARDTVIDVNGASDIAVEKLTVVGGRVANVRAAGCSRVAVREVTSAATAGTGIALTDCATSAVYASQIVDAADKGLQAFNCANCLMVANTIRNTATLAGMGLGGDGHYLGAELKGPQLVFAYNQVVGVGYIGVDLRGGVTATRNVVRDFNRVKIDGGGIYAYNAADLTVTDNYIADAPGSTAGTPWSGVGTQGIYVDDDSERVNVANNTIANVGASGVYLHNTRNVVVSQNTVVGAGEQSLEIVDDDLGSFDNTNLQIVDNQFVTTNPTALAMSVRTTRTPPNITFLAQLGTLDRNRYCDAFDDATIEIQTPSIDTVGSLADWQAASSEDAASTTCEIGRPPFLVSGTPGPELVGNGTFASGIDPWFGWPDEALVAAWDANGLNGGALRYSNNGNNDVVHIDAPIGRVANGTTYRLRFTARSDQEDATLTTFLRQLPAPYSELVPRVRIPLSTQATTYELFLTSRQAVPEAIAIFELGAATAQVWLDDVSVRSVPGRPIKPVDVAQIEVNATVTQRSVTVARASVDASGQSYAAGQQVTLAPFASIVLIAT